MIRKAEEMTVDLKERMRGGAGIVAIKHLFEAEELKSKTRLIARLTIPAGGTIGFHRHEEEEEVYYILSGAGEVDDDGTRKTIAPGDAMLTGAGRGHAVYNTGAEPLVIMAVIIQY